MTPKTTRTIVTIVLVNLYGAAATAAEHKLNLDSRFTGRTSMTIVDGP